MTALHSISLPRHKHRRRDRKLKERLLDIEADSAAGRLPVPQERWILLYGGLGEVDDDRAASPSSADNDKSSVRERLPTELFDQMVSGTGSVGTWRLAAEGGSRYVCRCECV